MVLGARKSEEARDVMAEFSSSFSTAIDWRARGASHYGGGRGVYEDHLAQVRLFRDLWPRELTWLSEGCREREYAAGAALARAGQGGARLIILLSGRVRVARPQSDGSERALAECGPGAVLGEKALVSAAVQPDTVTALEPCVALVLPVWDFQATLREAPDIAIKLLAVLGDRLVKAERQACLPASGEDIPASPEEDDPCSDQP